MVLASAVTEPGIVAPGTRDLDTLASDLSSWLKGRLPGADRVRIENLRYPLGAGMSHETILFDASWDEAGAARQQGMVVRIKPGGNPVYQDDMFQEQYALMELMHRSGHVRASRPLWFEPLPDLLGAPFFVMEKAYGRVPVSYPSYGQSGWVVDAAPAARRTMWHDAVTQLASIQKVSTGEAPFLHLPGGDTGFEQELDRWRRYMEWIDPQGAMGELRRGFERLLASLPDNKPEGIVWGDARFGNMMFSDDYHVVAVMDWEQPSLGGALHDLAWWICNDRNHKARGGAERLEGLGTREETIVLWEAVSGKSAADLDWYEAFAMFKMDCLGTNMSRFRDSLPAFPPGALINGFLDRA